MLSPLVLRWLYGLGGQSIGRWSLAMRSLSGGASKGGLGWIRGLRSPKKASKTVVFTMWWVEPKRTLTSAASWECDAASYRQETPGDAGKAGVPGCLGQGKQPRVQPARVGALEGQVGRPGVGSSRSYRLNISGTSVYSWQMCPLSGDHPSNRVTPSST